MSEQEKIQLFEDQKIRTAWDEDKEEWYFSVVDVIRALTGSENPRRYWSDLKRKLKAEGAVELYEKIVQFKMTAPDGKMRLTDVANTEQLLRIMPYEHGLPRSAASASRKPLTRNRPLTVLWKLISKRAMIRIGFTKGSFPSVSAMSSPTNGRSAEWKRDGSLLS